MKMETELALKRMEKMQRGLYLTFKVSPEDKFGGE